MFTEAGFYEQVIHYLNYQQCSLLQEGIQCLNKAILAEAKLGKKAQVHMLPLGILNIREPLL